MTTQQKRNLRSSIPETQDDSEEPKATIVGGKKKPEQLNEKLNNDTDDKDSAINPTKSSIGTTSKSKKAKLAVSSQVSSSNIGKHVASSPTQELVETGTPIATEKPNVAHAVTPERKGKHAKVPQTVCTIFTPSQTFHLG
jgi:hypothetical protein